MLWDACDERFSDMLVASPADAGGRGISLAVREGGAAADMTGATLYLAWEKQGNRRARHGAVPSRGRVGRHLHSVLPGCHVRGGGGRAR